MFYYVVSNWDDLQRPWLIVPIKWIKNWSAERALNGFSKNKRRTIFYAADENTEPCFTAVNCFNGKLIQGFGKLNLFSPL